MGRSYNGLPTDVQVAAAGDLAVPADHPLAPAFIAMAIRLTEAQNAIAVLQQTTQNAVSNEKLNSATDSILQGIAKEVANMVCEIYDRIDRDEKSHRLAIGGVFLEAQQAAKASASASLTIVREYCAAFTGEAR